MLLAHAILTQVVKSWFIRRFGGWARLSSWQVKSTGGRPIGLERESTNLGVAVAAGEILHLALPPGNS